MPAYIHMQCALTRSLDSLLACTRPNSHVTTRYIDLIFLLIRTNFIKQFRVGYGQKIRTTVRLEVIKIIRTLSAILNGISYLLMEI